MVGISLKKQEGAAEMRAARLACYNPSMGEIKVDQEQQKIAKKYARINRRMMLVELLVGGVYILLWLASGLSIQVREWLLGFTSSPWLLTPIFAGIFFFFYFLLGLPLSYYSGFILPHRFGLSNQSLVDWIRDQVKGLLIGGIIGLLVIEVIYMVLRSYPDTWWIWASLFLLFFTVLLANLAPTLIMPLFYKFQPLDEEHADLADRLKYLAEKAGTSVKGVYKFDMSRRTKAANAALTGVGGTRRIILGDTLINEFSSDEVETILAHELGHHVNKDIQVGIAFETLVTVVGLYLAHLGLRWGITYFGFQNSADVAALPLFMLVIGIYSLITMPLGNAFSRWRERRADAYALQMTGKNRAYASALARLANQNLADVDPEPWVEVLFYSHPALSRRINRALEHRQS
jgi:STE24 endopeptidase